MSIRRINGCKGRFIVKADGAAPGDPELIVADMTSFTFSRTAENTNFKVLNDCAEQSGEGTTAYTISGEGLYSTINADNQNGVIKEGQLFQWRFYPAFGDDAAVFVEGVVRASAIDLNVSPDENDTFTFSGDGDGAYTLAGGMW